MRNLFYDFLTAIGIMLGKKPLCGPRILQLNISDECNVNCIICNRACMGFRGFMEYEKAVKILDELYGLGLREVFFHGRGEPFLHPRILDMFRYVRNRYPRLRQFVVTNGTCISQEAVKEIIRGRVNVRFSLHAGDRQTWQQIHPHDNGSLFEQIEKTLSALNSGNSANTEILYVLFKTNYRNIGPMIDLALRAKVKKIIFRPMRFYNDGHGNLMNGNLMLTRQEYEMVTAELEKIKKQYKNRLKIDMVPFSLSRYDDELGRPSSFDVYRKNSCLIGWVSSLIFADGTVLGCLEESFDRPLGNVNEKKFAEIWWSEDYREFRRKQLFCEIEKIKKTDCPSWCQHLETNIKWNNLKKIRVLSLLKNFLCV